jgi:prolyl oligopeptidase
MPTTLQPAGKFDQPTGMEVKEVKVKSHDGTMVPLTLVYRKGLKRDGSNLVWLEGYGAYGVTLNPYFDPRMLAWLERGGILATAHVRGGGEFGEAWHVAGQKQTKANTWKDFVACAQYLIDQKYTTPQRLAGEGTSAGGILIGGAITERPDLFGAALINVGCADMLRQETTTNGVPNIPEFGTSKDADGFKALMAMSPYHRVKDGTAYPAVLLTTGMNDPRVDAWQPAKLAARLQAASTSQKPVLLRVDYAGGHGFGASREQQLTKTADQMAFLFWQLGSPEFQPK